MKPVWIVSARPTPKGRFLGALAKYSAVELGVLAGKAALSGVQPEFIDWVVVGNVLGAGLGMNIARQIGIGIGLQVSPPALTVNMMCASGLRAVIAHRRPKRGLATLCVGGGSSLITDTERFG